MVDAFKRDILTLYENAVAQMLTAKGHELFYYTFMNKSMRHNYEIDFIIAKKIKFPKILKRTISFQSDQYDYFIQG
ncbi:MAG: putative ATPase superfamily [Eubacterium sp.]|jgi:predicted AAA+ superfamily ATPase|nr:putative ATPase superfamily [Eubacterium sp.]